MSAPHSFLRATDERWGKCPNIVELASEAADPDGTGVGTSPYLGDIGSPGIRVPTAPTTTQTNRYLFRLCGVEIPPRRAISIRGLRQAATIRHVETVNGVPLILERPVVTPFWRFLDGNISWHLRLQQQQFAPKANVAFQIPGTDPTMRNLDSALLYTAPAPVPYTALNAGRPPGTAIQDMGTFHDIRYPWDDDNWTMDMYIRGPGAVVFYASVHQTDPVGRPLYPSVSGMTPEDLFLSNFRDARYGRVAGGMIFELLPCCPQPEAGGEPPHLKRGREL